MGNQPETHVFLQGEALDLRQVGLELDQLWFMAYVYMYYYYYDYY